MAKYAWASDVHLDFIANDNQKMNDFARSLVADDPSGIFLTGDISTARKLISHLSFIEAVVKRPIYFTLGNHDYYGADLEQVRKAMKDLTNMSPFLKYMPTMPYYALSQDTAVVGHDGWYDAYYGDWQNSSFGMADWSQIGDFIPVRGNKASIVGVSRKIAHEGATHVAHGIKQAVRYHKNIIVLTHFPPFPQAHQHQGKQGDDNAMPWYTSKTMGDMLLQASAAYAATTFTVLCGHTHGKWSGKITNNLRVEVAGAEYSDPRLQALIEVS